MDNKNIRFIVIESIRFFCGDSTISGLLNLISLPTHTHSLAINPHLKMWISSSLPLPIMAETGALFAASLEHSLFIQYPLTPQSLCQHIIFQNSSYTNCGVPHFQKCWTPYKHQRTQPTSNCMQTCKSE